MAANEWSAALREARLAMGLSRRALADRAHVSPATIKAYELGVRSPSRPYLAAMLDALKVDRGTRNRIFEGAGFAPDGLGLRPSNADLHYTLEEAAEEIERYGWPAFVVNEMIEVVAANQVAQRLWGVDLRREFTGPLERNMLTVATNPRFAARCANWDEAVGTMIAVFKGHHRGPETLEAPSPYFSAVLRRLFEGDATYVKRFLDLWQRTPPIAGGKMRWSYHVVWDEPGVGTMRFHSFTSSANEPDGLSFNDWIPLDAESWERLEELKRRASP